MQTGGRSWRPCWKPRTTCFGIGCKTLPNPLRPVFVNCSSRYVVNRADHIELHIGSSGWMHGAQLAVTLLSIYAVFASQSGTLWVLLFLGLLGSFHAVCALGPRRASRIDRLWLDTDGSAILLSTASTQQARLCTGGWVSRWFSVVPLQEVVTGHRVRCLVCRSRNTPDAYRRLLVNVRMSNSANRKRGVVLA